MVRYRRLHYTTHISEGVVCRVTADITTRHCIINSRFIVFLSGRVYIVRVAEQARASIRQAEECVAA